jgi:hypothetical protein
LCGLAVSARARGQWSTVSQVFDGTSPYRCWTRSDGVKVDEVVYLDHSTATNGTITPIPFCGQGFADLHGVYNDAGEMLLLGEGGTINPGNAIGDSIVLVKRLTSGRFDTNPSPDATTRTSMVLHFPPIAAGAPECPPSPATCDWSWRGGLGAGAAIAKTKIASAGGYKYFALVVVGDFNGYQYGHPRSATDKSSTGCADPNTPNGAQAWLGWAVSQDGVTWKFAPANGGTPTTTDPAGSMRLIARQDDQFSFLSDPPPSSPCAVANGGPGKQWNTRYWHLSMFYNKYDNYFYIVSGFAELDGLHATWWRMLFNPEDTYGVGPLDLLGSNGTQFSGKAGCTDASGNPVHACVPLTETWGTDAQFPNPNDVNVGNNFAGVDPMDISQLNLCSSGCNAPLYGTTFDSYLFFYLPGLNAFACPPDVRYIKGSSPTFPFFDTSAFAPKLLDTTAFMAPIPNSLCTPNPPITMQLTPLSDGGRLFPAVMQLGNQADGSPSLTSFFDARRMDIHSQPSICQGNSDNRLCDHLSGAIPVNLSLTSTAPVPNITSISPRGGPPSAGTLVTINGTNFHSGTGFTVKFGGTSGTSATVVSSTQVTAITPALTGGAPADVAVVNGATHQTATLDEGFLPDYTDVGPGGYHDYINAITRDHIVVGYGDGRYGPLDPVNRETMAIFLLKSKNSSFAYLPIPGTGTMFSDVPGTDPFDRWVEALARLGITSGCGGGKYCPLDPTKRGEMSVFLLKSKLGAAYVPPHNCGSGTLTDVNCTTQFADWIYDANSRGYMATCSPSHFCPDSSVARQEMAQDVYVTFALP